MTETPTPAAPSGTVGAVVRPSRITEEMMRFSRTDDLWHYAANLNAMLEHGYCNKCGLTPNGCEREGCRANNEVRRDSAAPGGNDGH